MGKALILLESAVVASQNTIRPAGTEVHHENAGSRHSGRREVHVDTGAGTVIDRDAKKDEKKQSGKKGK